MAKQGTQPGHHRRALHLLLDGRVEGGGFALLALSPAACPLTFSQPA